MNFLSIIVEELKEEGNADLLLEDMKNTLKEMTLSKEVSEILNDVFGTMNSSAKKPNVQKLRQNPNVSKIFSSLVVRTTPTRTKQKPKFFDDFVVVPPSEKVP